MQIQAEPARYSTQVLIIGTGGAGLRAAIELHNRGYGVLVLGKRPKTDAHTVLAEGGINAAQGGFPVIQGNVRLPRYP